MCLTLQLLQLHDKFAIFIDVACKHIIRPFSMLFIRHYRTMSKRNKVKNLYPKNQSYNVHFGQGGDVLRLVYNSLIYIYFLLRSHH